MFKLLATARNPLLAVDAYKDGHKIQYRPGTKRIFSYLVMRSDKYMNRAVFFGLQYYLKQYLETPLERWMADEYIETRRDILGDNIQEISDKLYALCDLGYWPLKIKAAPEGMVLGSKNVVATVTNTHDDFAWCVGAIEDLLTKVWYPTTVASTSLRYRMELEKRFRLTCPEMLDAVRFSVHDFGYRGDTSEESAAISGTAHLTCFTGSDTFPAHDFAKSFYGHSGKGLMGSVPANEHSVVCSYGKGYEIDAFKRMLELYPTKIVSLVSDTYNFFDVMEHFTSALMGDIITRPDGAKVVFRPDSGDPIKIICGNPDATEGTAERKGALQMLGEKFGYTTNKAGFKVLNPKVGLIYGDGMFFERWTSILDEMERQGWAACNLVIGVGGILRWHTRDTLGFAMKAVYLENENGPMEIMKDPITDPRKKSHKGLVGLFRKADGQIVTVDELTPAEENHPGNLLKLVYENGESIGETHFEDVRRRVETFVDSQFEQR